MATHPWARNFSVDKTDVDFLTTLLLEKETPLSTEALARVLIEHRLQHEADLLHERYKDTLRYDPAQAYSVGQKLVFPAFDDAMGVVVHVRPGSNEEYGTFSVIGVRFDDDDQVREFAAEFAPAHRLSQPDGNGSSPLFAAQTVSIEDILSESRAEVLGEVEKTLRAQPELVTLAGVWFPRDLLMEVNVGHLNLAEAVLDMNGGGPLTPEQMVEEIGGIGESPLSLQVFSLNYALRDDRRFDEVGPTGEVMWFLSRLEPDDVRQLPAPLRYTPLDYDRNLLTPDLLALEAEIGDELSNLPTPPPGEQATITLSYPHRRAGTLPLTPALRAIFPSARSTPRVWLTLVDGQDEEEYTGWVVRSEGYVVGLTEFYRKHRLPVGTYLSVSRTEDSHKIRISFVGHRARTEYLRLIQPKGDQLTFENHKRAIGADYDELMILGIDDLAGVDAVQQQWRGKTISAILKNIIPGLGRLTPQGTVHARTIYSVFNVLRRCPPGPIFATLVANPDFQNVGGHYWKLVD